MPDWAENGHSLFKFRLPTQIFGSGLKTWGVYLSGGLRTEFAIGFWVFMDVALYSREVYGGEAHVTFVDWLPGICSVLGTIVVNSIDKGRLTVDSFSLSGGDPIVWKARVILFLGFALLAGGLAGAFTVMVIKYIVHGYPMQTQYFGIGNVIANGLMMLSSTVLWITSSVEDDYQYSLSL